jgi:hypothetical protein
MFSLAVVYHGVIISLVTGRKGPPVVADDGTGKSISAGVQNANLEKEKRKGVGLFSLEG